MIFLTMLFGAYVMWGIPFAMVSLEKMIRSGPSNFAIYAIVSWLMGFIALVMLLLTNL